jgi:5-formyltetrahydrofolate cyclo-ligase
VLTPLVAFDLALNRIGVGGGFYDRTFAFTKMSDVADRPVLIGVAFELQKLDAIVPKAWDVRLDLVVTEDAIYQAD